LQWLGAVKRRLSASGGLSEPLSSAVVERLVPDALWEIVEPLIPRFAARPQGVERAGRRSCDLYRDRVCADKWVRVAAPSALVRSVRPYRAPPVHRMGGGGGVRKTASSPA